MDNIPEFGEHLAKARHLKGFTQGELAKRAGLHSSIISQYERGRRSVSYKNLYKLTIALEVRADFLLGIEWR